MAERASVSEIAKKYENKFNPDRYIKAAERLKPGPALAQLKEGVNQAQINGKATSDVYEKFAKGAESIKGKIPQDGNYRVLSQYEDFITSCKSHAGHFYKREKPVRKSSSPRP
ncbi:MAG TPA: hypothetical protein VJ485_03175 [archaeon]|nr:hypothetical protein [archaeon]